MMPPREYFSCGDITRRYLLADIVDGVWPRQRNCARFHERATGTLSVKILAAHGHLGSQRVNFKRPHDCPTLII
jgi:hypothetical protein